MPPTDGTFTVNRSMQRVQKDTLAQVDKGCILRIFPDKLEGSKTSLILKTPRPRPPAAPSL